MRALGGNGCRSVQRAPEDQRGEEKTEIKSITCDIEEMAAPSFEPAVLNESRCSTV